MLPLLAVLYPIGTTLFVKGIRRQYENKQMKLLHCARVTANTGKGYTNEWS